MARPAKRYRIRVRGRQRNDIDADLLMQALLLMAEEAEQYPKEPKAQAAGAEVVAPSPEPTS